MDDNAQTKPKSRRRWGAGRWMLFVLALVSFTGGAVLISATGTRFTAPDWLRAKVTERINRDIHGFSVAFGEVSLVVSHDWVPRLSLQDVTLRDAAGLRLANLSNVRSAVALGPLLRGNLQPASIHLSGARVTLRRSASGGVRLSVGGTAPPVEEAETFVALADRLEEFLQRPHFADLRRVEASNLTLRYEDARAGRAWTVDGGRLEMTRDGDDLRIRGDFALLGARDYATTLEMTYTGRIGQAAADFGVSFEDMPARDIATQSPGLSWLEALQAPISGALRASVDASGALGPLNATLQIGAGALRPTQATAPVAFTSARTYFTYAPGTQMIRFDEIRLDSKWITARAEGQAHLGGMAEGGWPEELLGQFRVSEITANPANLYPEPITIAAATMDMRLQLDPFVLSLGEMSFADRGRHLVLKGEARARPEGWRVALDGRMDGIAPERLLELWPVSLKPKTREWIDENVHRAVLRNIQIAIRSQPRSRPDLFLGFDFEDLATRFIKDVPPIKAASGHASLYDERFVITADSGHVVAAEGGRVDIAGTSFSVPNVRIKRGPARVDLASASTITAALSLLDEEPFRFLQKADRPVTLADGRARLSGRLDFLLKQDLQPDEVAFDVAGALSDVRSETVVKGRVLAASSLDVQADNTELSINGTGRIGRVPIGGTWTTPLRKQDKGRSRVEGWIELSERFADEFRIGLPPGSISGAGRANVAIDMVKGEPGVFRLSSTLDGVGLSLRQLDWRLPEAATGELEVSGRLGQPPQIGSLRIDAGGLSADGRIDLTASGQLDRAVFSTVAIGEWLRAPVTLVGRGAGVPPAVEVRGGRVDLRQTSLAGGGRDGTGGGAGDRGPVSLRLESLQVSDGIALTDVRADLEMAGGAQGTFAGKVNGGAAISGRVVPQDGRSAFRITSDDAGGVMGAAGLLKQARGGEMDLVLTPAEAPGTYNGRLDARSVRLTDAPALAALLNALSIVGLLEQLAAGEGIHFGQVDARFQLSPERLTLLSGSAVGASMGLSMDGYYHMNTGRMDMRGVISPLYMVNMIGGVMNRRGEGLIGFNYQLTGPAKNPRVSVNPFSAFTPGIFREIFRRPPPQVGGATTQGPPPRTEQEDSVGERARRLP